MRARGSDRLRRPANVREDARRGLAPSVLLRLVLGQGPRLDPMRTAFASGVDEGGQKA